MDARSPTIARQEVVQPLVIFPPEIFITGLVLTMEDGVFTRDCALKGSLAVKIGLFASKVKRELWRRLGADLKLQRILSTNFPLAETY